MLQANDSSFRKLANALLGASHLLLRHPLDGDPEPAAFAVLAPLCQSAALRPSELASAVRLDLSTISRHIQALEADGYLVKTKDPRDGRSYRLKATASGRAAINRVAARRVELFRRATAHWTPQDLRRLVELLSRLTDDLKTRIGIYSAGESKSHRPGGIPEEGRFSR